MPIAGMELTTAEDIHIVCLFESLEQAMLFDAEVSKHLLKIENRSEIFGDQLILDGNDEIIGKEKILLISATDLMIDDAISLARSFGAHVHPAHIDRESNGIISTLGNIPAEYEFDFYEFNDPENISEYKKRFSYIENDRILVCSDAHHLWDISEAEHSLEIDDFPYSSALVRKKLFEYLNSFNK